MNNPEKEPFSWRKRGKSFVYAFNGLRSLISNEHNSRLHVAAAVTVTVFGFIFHISRMEWCLVLLCIGLVFSAEALNSAIEALADKVSPEQDPLIGKAKDYASGAVLALAIASAAIAAIIFIPKFFGL